MTGSESMDAQPVEPLTAEAEAIHAWVIKLARFSPSGAFGRELRDRLATLDARAGMGLDRDLLIKAEERVRAMLDRRDPKHGYWVDSPRDHLTDLFAAYTALVDAGRRR